MTTKQLKTFKGTRLQNSVVVSVDGRPLRLYLEVVNHSPTGFEWGYGGSGPAQLAFAILAEMYGADRALSLYQDFKWQVVARFPKNGWTLTSGQINDWLVLGKVA